MTQFPPVSHSDAHCVLRPATITLFIVIPECVALTNFRNSNAHSLSKLHTQANVRHATHATFMLPKLKTNFKECVTTSLNCCASNGPLVIDEGKILIMRNSQIHPNKAIICVICQRKRIECIRDTWSYQSDTSF